jgi:MFS transporter, PAT family, solute carrier family 33 (acetyl-CoA transportor), member 1
MYCFPEQTPIPTYYLALVLVFFLMSSMASTFMMVSQCAFFVRVSDKTIGGTYQTLLTTITNFGTTWPRFFVLYLVDITTWSHCILPSGI